MPKHSCNWWRRIWTAWTEADAVDQGRLDKAFALDIDPRNHLPNPEDIRSRIRKHEAALE